MLEDIGSREPCVLMVHFCAKIGRYVATNAFESLFFISNELESESAAGHCCAAAMAE